MAAKNDNDELLERLLAIFAVEAAEHLQTMGTLLQALQQAAPDAAQTPLLESLFRETHSLKGAARSVNLSEIEAICMGLESTLAALKRQPPDALPPAWFASTYRIVDELERR
ncbi:MAG: Hpt domain-containing protein, partial [Rhodocyclaceae bacterium]